MMLRTDEQLLPRLQHAQRKGRFKPHLALPEEEADGILGTRVGVVVGHGGGGICLGWEVVRDSLEVPGVVRLLLHSGGVAV